MITLTILATGLLTALAAPHVLRLESVQPATAVVLWLADLTVRALLCVYLALFVILYLPSTELYALISHWCWHGVIPFLATHLRFTGHDIGDAAALGPAIILAASLAWGSLGAYRAARAVRRLLHQRAVGTGPGHSVILKDQQVMIAAAGIRRPQLVVSAGALLALDDEELAAGLDHERGHIAHRHRYAMLAADALGSIARFLPGTRRAQAELLFHLERDADQYALDRAHHPTSLASAICKAAESTFASTGPAMALGGSSVVRRLHVLLDGPAPRRSASALAIGTMLCLSAITILGILALPAAAHAGIDAGTLASIPMHSCPD